MKDSKGQPFEEWEDIVKRVVGHVSKAETGEKRDKFFAAMSEVMLAREFIPREGRTIRKAPALEMYLTQPDRTPPADQLTEVMMPVR